jgi:tetratricopeptide (TPR) repeat protein
MKLVEMKVTKAPIRNAVLNNFFFGATDNEFQAAKGMTQRELASPYYTHVHVSTVETGKRRASREALEHFASKLGVEVEELLTGQSPADRSELALELEEIAALLSHGQLDDVEARLARLVADVRLGTYPDLVGRSIELRARLAERRGDWEEAFDLFGSADQQRRIESLPSAAAAVAGQVRVLRPLGDLHYSIFIGERYLTVLDKEGLATPDAVTLVLSPLVLAYFETGAKARAGELAERLLAMAESVEDPVAVGCMYVNVARVQHGRGDTSEAERSLSRASSIFAQLDMASERAVSLVAHGYLLAERNDPTGRKKLREATEQLVAANNEIEAGNALLELGRLERRLGNDDAALQALDEGLALVRGRDDGYTAGGLREKARVLMSSDHGLAQKFAEEALELWERIGDPSEVAATRALLGQIFERAGDRDSAYEQFRAAALHDD